MMRITKKDLEQQIDRQRKEIIRLKEENKFLDDKLTFVQKFISNPAMIIAMERITDALAHTISDLKRR